MHVNEGLKNTYQVIEAWSRSKITRVEGFEWKKSVWEEKKEILLRERSEKWDLIRTQPIYRNCSLMDRSICQDLSITKSRQKWICRGAIEDLSMAKTLRWIENLSRIYWPDRRFRNWLDGSKKLSRIYRGETQKSRWIENPLFEGLFQLPSHVWSIGGITLLGSGSIWGVAFGT